MEIVFNSKNRRKPRIYSDNCIGLNKNKITFVYIVTLRANRAKRIVVKFMIYGKNFPEIDNDIKNIRIHN